MSILTEAEALITGARSASYGHALDNFTTVARFWTEYLARKHALVAADICLSAEDVALMMTLLKIAREAFKSQRDNPLDAAGYLGCLEQVQVERQRRAVLEFDEPPCFPETAYAEAREDTPTIRTLETRTESVHDALGYCRLCNKLGVH